jgi:hypothetical protein
LSKNPPILVRVNATRLLAVAAKSGAPAFAKTIGDLLTHKFFKIGDKFVQTPPEVYFHAIRAAEGLLGSYHPVWHLDPAKLTRHALKDDDLIPLVKILMDIVQNGPTIMASAYAGDPVPPKLASPIQPSNPAAKIDPKNPLPPAQNNTAPKLPTTTGVLEQKTLTKDQLLVYEMYRRQAVRALAKVRFDIFASNTPNEIRPAFLLAKVAVSDFSLSPAPSQAEISEAVIGLLGITPSTNLRIDEWLYCIARGTELMVAPKLEAEDNQTLPWKLTAARMNATLANLRKTSPQNARFRPYQTSINKLCEVISTSIMNPLEKDDPNSVTKPTRDQLGAWMEQNPPKDPARSLFDDKPEYKLNSRQGR